MNWQVIKFRFYWWCRKIILNGLYFLVVFLVASFALLQFPSVQTALTSRMMRGFTAVSGFEITYDKFYLVWYDRLEIEGLRILDPAKNLMIAAERLQVNFELSTLLSHHDINLDAATLHGGQVNLVTLPETDTTKDLNINLFIAEINKQFASGGTGGASPKINIGEIVLDQSAFSYNNTDRDSIRQGFDYYHFRVGVPEGEVDDFKVIGDTIQLQVRTLVATELKTKLDIKELQSFFRYSKMGMEFLGMNLKAGQSVITDSVVFRYQSPASFSDFNNKVNFSAKLKGTVIHPADLALFAPGAEALGQPLHLAGNLDGKVARFTYHHMHVGVGTTQIAGQLDIDGLPSINETFINLSLKNGEVTMRDLRFLFPEDIYGKLEPLGSFHVTGNFIGFINDFVANGDFETPLGKIKSDINLKILEGKINESVYQGNLALADFDLGSYLQDTINFQKVSLQGQIKGKGLTEKTANFLLNGTISSVGLLHYNYSNITTNAQFSSQLFNGKLTVDDPNLKFNADGFVDFRKGQQIVNIKATLDTAFLLPLNLSRDKIFISSYIDINSRGLQIDSLFGRANFKNVTLLYRNDTLRLDSLHVISGTDGLHRKLTLNSSLLDINLEGNYYYSTLFSDATTLFHEFYLNLKNDKAAINSYYTSKRKRSQAYDAEFQMALHNINPLAKLMNLDVRVCKNILLKGKFSNGFTSIVHAVAQIDSLRYQDKLFLNSEIEMSASKVRDSTDVLAAVTITSARQEFSPAFKSKNLLIEAIWNGEHVDLGLDFDQEGNTNLVRLKSEIDFLQDSTQIKILPSRIKALEQEWVVDQKNYTLLKGKEWLIHHLEIHHENQSILLDGRVSAEPIPGLKLTVSNLGLDIINPLSTEKFAGIVNGNVNARDVYHSLYVQNDISIQALTVNNFLIGNVAGTNVWNQQEDRFDINFFIDRLDKRIINLTGYYNPNEKKSPLNVTANLENANVKIIEPVLRGLFSQIDGTLTGEYTITGTFSSPKIKGEGKISGGQIMIDYLKTTYTFTGIVGMVPNQVIFKDFHLVDAFNNKATLNGYLAHRDFSQMHINLDAAFKNFQILNTSAKDNSLFYGQGYATGDLNIFGPIANMKISAKAKTQKNTKIFIPINGTETTEKKDFINFTHFTDSVVIKANRKKPKEKVELSGITMDLNLDVTPDAFAEIIFDIKSGDIIRGRGNGDLNLQIDTKGEFNMFGVVEFTEGAYNFTLYDIINKEFAINKGSRISWYGDPYQATLNITASYRQLTSLAPILSDQTLINEPSIKRMYPVEVLLKLTDLMMSPSINFDIDAPALPVSVPVTVADKPPVQLRFEFNAFKAKLDEQELKKQVFSLIMLRRFSPYGESISTSGTFANSVSELFSNQLSYWLSQVDQNLEIDLDLKGMNQEAFNTFQLRLSYSFLNGRLRVTRDGAFNNNQSNRSDISGIAGDWTVDYFLTPDGKFKVKMYSRSNVSSLTNSLGTQTALTTGVSLLHTQNFNQVKDLLRSARNRKKDEEEKQKEDQQKNDQEEATKEDEGGN